MAGSRYTRYHHLASPTRPTSPDKPAKDGVADVHNLVILSREPARESEALRHRLVPPLPYRSLTGEPEEARDLMLEWDRPLLRAVFETATGVALHVQIGRASCRERVCQYV